MHCMYLSRYKQFNTYASAFVPGWDSAYAIEDWGWVRQMKQLRFLHVPRHLIQPLGLRQGGSEDRNTGRRHLRILDASIGMTSWNVCWNQTFRYQKLDVVDYPRIAIADQTERRSKVRRQALD